MKRALLGLMLTASLVGCGTQADPRLMPNDTLRRVCFQASDDTIRSVLSTLETTRMNGSTKVEALYYTIGGCNQFCEDNYANDPSTDQTCHTYCLNCITAEVDQIYGQ